MNNTSTKKYSRDTRKIFYFRLNNEDEHSYML